jgi:two-component system, NtrC family, response regulator AlgB
MQCVFNATMEQRRDKPTLNVLVVDDELNIRKTLAMSVEVDGHAVVAVSNADDALDQAGKNSFDLAFVDLRLGSTHGLDLIPGLLAQSPWIKVVVITAHGTIDSAVQTMKLGAFDYLTKPFTPAQVRLVTERVMQFRALEQKVAGLQGIVDQSGKETKVESSSPLMQRVLSFTRQIAASDTTVLLRGESGTGKGVLARAIHSWSDRAPRPFATVSCPTLSAQLLESELFGHSRGSFTGAIRDNPGRIAACDGGTLFLDEIGDLPLELQPKLLRFVQDREFERVGDPQTRRADVRLITATNVNLEEAVKAGKFREDLLYRIQVVQVDLPALRERTEDIPRLCDALLAELRRSRPIIGFTADAMAALRGYRWPGNIRELRNVIERAVILCQTDHISIEHLPTTLTPREAPIEVGDRIPLDKLEEMHIRRVLASTKSLDEAASVLDIDLATLWRRRKKYGI